MRTAVTEYSTIDSYFRSLGGVESLDGDVEKELARRWRDGDPLAGKRLIEGALPFVVHIARKYRRWGAPLEDLIQQGNLGLLSAAERFDPSKGCRLVTYAAFWIRSAIRDYLVRTYRLTRVGTTREERRAIRTFRLREIRSAEQLAELSGLSAARAAALYPLLARGETSLDVGDTHTPLDMHTPEARFVEVSDAARLRAAIDLALAALNPRERHIVRSRGLADDPLSLSELAVAYGVSKERIRQIEERAHEKLRDALAHFAPV